MLRDLLDVQLAVGDGLAVRPWRPEDAPGLFETVVANRAYLGAWLRWAESLESVASAEEFIRTARAEALEGRGFQCAITLDDAVIGATGFDTLSDIQGEIGYWLAERHAGRGVMTRCCLAVIDYGFGELGLHRIQILADSLNRRSRAVAERLGFTLEGTRREDARARGADSAREWSDTVVYSLLDREWPPAR